MKILFLSQWFNPEPIFKGLTYVKELAARGHEVEVLTGYPNYPGGKTYDGYRQRWLQRETMEGISVLRVPIYPSHDHSKFRRAWNYGSFALSSATIGASSIKTPDVMHVYQPITIGLGAAVIRAARRVPYVLDVQDLWPDFLPATGMITNERALDAVGKWCDLVYSNSDAITTLSPGFRESILGRGVAPEKVEVVYNWCDEGQVDLSDDREESLAVKHGLAGKFNVMFAGSMGKAQALEAVLSAAALLKDSHRTIQFVFVGGGVEVDNLKAMAGSLNLENVLFIPRQPLKDIGQILKWADVQLIHLRNDPLFATTIPSKTQTSLAIGRPILMGVPGDALALVESAGAGIPCIPESSDSIAEGVTHLFDLGPEELDRMGKRGRDFYRKELSLAAGVDRYEAIFNRLARRSA